MEKKQRSRRGVAGHYSSWNLEFTLVSVMCLRMFHTFPGDHPQSSLVSDTRRRDSHSSTFRLNVSTFCGIR
jgi:hypothetical protein